MTSTPHVGMDDDRLQGARGQLARPAGDLGVAEAVEGLGGLGAAQRPRAEFAVLQDLTVADDDLVPGLALDREAQPADEVLPEVRQRAARRRRPDAHWRDGFVADDGRPDIRREAAGVELERFDAAPCR